MKKTIKILLFITFVFAILSISTKVKAATATIKASSNSVQVGDKVTLSININAASWSLTVSGDGITTKKYADVTSDGTVGNKTESINLDTSSAGEKLISLKGTVSEPSGEGTKKTEINTSVKVTVKEKTSNPSGGNNTTEPKKGTLSTCYINGIKVNEYLTVKNKESVPVAINTSTKEGATIYNSNTKETYNVKSGSTTNIKLAEGTNTLTITLQSGNKYTRKIYSQKEEEVKPNIIENPDEKILLKSLEIKGKDENDEEIKFTLTPNFFKEAFEYLITIPEEQSYITSLDIEAVGQKSEYIIEVTGNEDLVFGENVITILVKSKDGSKQTTYTVKVNKLGEPEQTEPVVAPVETTTNDENKADSKMVKYIKIFIVGFTLIVLFAGIMFAIIEYNYGKYKNEYKPKKSKKEEIKEEDDYKIRFSSISHEEPVAPQNFSEVEEDNTKKKGKHF